MNIWVNTPDGTHDITEGVRALYDHVVGSMDWGSGFLSADDMIEVVELAKLCGFEGIEDAEQQVAALRKQQEKEAERERKRKEKAKEFVRKPCSPDPNSPLHSWVSADNSGDYLYCTKCWSYARVIPNLNQQAPHGPSSTGTSSPS